ncbi:hypothetical protein ACTZGP_21870 [Pseudomonas putida]|jgi:hypothetical protein|uniref:hypothetical protein n=1 Tax=Pseudomonas TaxID=286 RepID=UPI001412F792|nr:hypothetical protein [Pseudomonas koreensis]NHX02171.1 hypothetical protein [Pseudomonas koreensis]
MNGIYSIPPVTDAVNYETWKKQWTEQEGLDVFSYISDQCHPEQMLLFSKVFFPDFLTVGEGVFLERNFAFETFSARMAEMNDVREVERIINNVHVYDLFDQCADNVSDSVFFQLCNVIAFSWRMVLKEKFPDQKFFVEVSNSESDYGPVITFFQVGE